MRTTRHGANGFSLLELLVVIGIFGLLVAVAIPGIASYLRSARIEGAANTLAADLRLTRSLASSQRKNYAVAFAPTSYSVVRLTPRATVLKRALPRGVSFTAPDSATFFAWGLTEAATIRVGDAGRSSTVRLLATGSVSND